MYNTQLDTFICVAEEGSFSKAAAKLFISTQAVVKQINALESTTGLTLLIRTHRGVTLTDAGRSFFWDAKDLIQSSKEMVTRARRAETQKQVVRLGVSIITSAEIFNQLIPQIQKKYPEMQFKMVVFGNSEDNTYSTRNNLGKDIDVVLLMCDNLPHKNYQALPLYYEPIGCAVSIQHPLAARERLKVEDLYNHNFYLLKRGINAYLDQLRDYLEKRHPQIRIVDLENFSLQSFNRCESSRNMMFGIEKWNGKHPLVRIIPVDWDFKIPLGLLYPKEPTDIVRKFIDAAAHEFRAQNPQRKR